MSSRSFMLIAGEASGDHLAAELVRSLRRQCQSREGSFEPIFFGAGGPQMAEAGVDLAVEMTGRSTIGLLEAVKQYGYYRSRFNHLLKLARDRQPEAIIGIDFSGFNRRFAGAVKRHTRSRRRTFNNWQPKLIQYVSPQVWASRAGRARKMAAIYDLVLCLFPFEADWYAKHAPSLKVEYIGHPMMDRYRGPLEALGNRDSDQPDTRPPFLVMLPGSRNAELERHVPVMLDALKLILRIHPDLRTRIVVPNPELATIASQLATSAFKDLGSIPVHRPPPRPSGSDHGSTEPLPINESPLEICVGHLEESLAQADTAMASTGTVTLECAFFGVPTVTLYRTSWSTYEIGKRIIRVDHLAMPNIIAGETIYPELIQHDATPENLAKETLALLNEPGEASLIRKKLGKVLATLGPPGAVRRASQAIMAEIEGSGPDQRPL